MGVLQQPQVYSQQEEKGKRQVKHKKGITRQNALEILNKTKNLPCSASTYASGTPRDQSLHGTIVSVLLQVFYASSNWTANTQEENAAAFTLPTCALLITHLRY